MNWPAIWMSSSVHSLWHIMLKIFCASNSAFTCFTWASHPAVLHFMNMSNNARFLLTIKFGPFFYSTLIWVQKFGKFLPQLELDEWATIVCGDFSDHAECLSWLAKDMLGWIFFSLSELPYCEGWTSPSSDVFFHFTRRNAVQSRHKEDKAQKKSWECHSKKMDFFLCSSFPVRLLPSRQPLEISIAKADFRLPLCFFCWIFSLSFLSAIRSSISSMSRY